MKGEVFIHVGLPKTGTTFLRTQIFPKIENIVYAKTPIGFYDVDRDVKYLLSNESLSGVPFKRFNPYSCNRYLIMDYLNKIYPDAKIILCLRNKETIKKSLYSQYIEQGGLKGFDDFIKYELRDDWMDFDKYVRYIKKYFDCCIYHFEDLESGIEQICNFMDVDVPEYENKICNKGWNGNQKRLGILCNRFWKSPRFYIDKYLVEGS